MIIPDEIMEMLKRVYGDGRFRIVLYGDGSGHIDKSDFCGWAYDLQFCSLSDLGARLAEIPAK